MSEPVRTKLKPEVKEKWLNALRSGEYEQTNGCLRDMGNEKIPSGYCCLGVLCDVYIKDTGKGHWWNRNTDPRPDEEGCKFDEYRFSLHSDNRQTQIDFPPSEVYSEWAGVEHYDPSFSVEEAIVAGVWPARFAKDMYGWTTLSSVNDKGATFAEIAAIIEKLL